MKRKAESLLDDLKNTEKKISDIEGELVFNTMIDSDMCEVAKIEQYGGELTVLLGDNSKAIELTPAQAISLAAWIYDKFEFKKPKGVYTKPTDAWIGVINTVLEDLTH